MICPHCGVEGDDGKCRFVVSRRSFLFLGLGAAAALALPKIPALIEEPFLSHTQIIRTPFGFTSRDAMIDMGNEIHLYRPTANPLVVLAERMKENRAALAFERAWRRV